MGSDRPDESFAALFEQTKGTTPRRRRPHVGDMVEATVLQVGRDAVFVELGDRQQGFIEAADVRGPDGKGCVSIGDVLRARVVHVDAEHGVRLVPTADSAAALGAEVPLSNAGEAAAVKIAVGQAVSGVVDRVESYGVFLQIDGTKGRAGRGLVPTAELGAPRGADVRKGFPVGTKLTAKVVEIGEGKLRLSLRALKDDEERSQFDRYRKQDETEAPHTFGTLGDLLKKRSRK